MIRWLLTLPNSYIEHRVDRRGLKREFVVVIVCGLLGVPGLAWVASQALGAAEQELPVVRFNLIGKALQPFIIIVAAWLLFAGLGHVVGRFYNARGPAARLLRAAGWTVIPLGIWNAIRSIVTVAVFWNADFPSDPSGFTAEEKVATIMDLGTENPLYPLSILVGVLFTVWSWWLLTLAVELAKNVSRDEAQRIAAVPAGLFALWIIYRTAQVAGVL